MNRIKISEIKRVKIREIWAREKICETWFSQSSQCLAGVKRSQYTFDDFLKMLRLFKTIRPSSGYHTDQPPTTSKHTAELFDEVRDNGRILDNWRIVLGGTDILEAEFPLAKLFDDPVLQDAHPAEAQGH
jgi:hypothetical protein